MFDLQSNAHKGFSTMQDQYLTKDLKSHLALQVSWAKDRSRHKNYAICIYTMYKISSEQNIQTLTSGLIDHQSRWQPRR